MNTKKLKRKLKEINVKLSFSDVFDLYEFLRNIKKNKFFGINYLSYDKYEKVPLYEILATNNSVY